MNLDPSLTWENKIIIPVLLKIWSKSYMKKYVMEHML